MGITNSQRYKIPSGGAISAAVYGSWVYLVPVNDVVQDLTAAAIVAVIDSTGAGVLLPLGAQLSTLRSDGVTKAKSLQLQNNGPTDLILQVISGEGFFQPPYIDFTAHEDATAAILVQESIDTHVVAAGNLAHADAGTAHADILALKADVDGGITTAHNDAVAIDGAVVAVGATLTALRTDVDNGITTAHNDAAAIDGAVVAVGTTLTALKTDVDGGITTAHNDADDIKAALAPLALDATLVALKTDVDTGITTAHNDAVAVAAAAAASPYLAVPAATAGPLNAVCATAGAFTTGIGTVHAPALKLVAGVLSVLGGGSVQGKAYLKITKNIGGAVLVPLAVVSPSPLVEGMAVLPHPILLEDLDVLTMVQDAGAAASQFDGIIA